MRNILLVLGALLLFFSIGRANSHQVYTVRPGDTLYDISLAYGISWKELAELNKIKDPTKMQVGTKLRLPADAKLRTLEPGETIVPITPQEKELLTRLVYAEARGESLEGQIAVVLSFSTECKAADSPTLSGTLSTSRGSLRPFKTTPCRRRQATQPSRL